MLTMPALIRQWLSVKKITICESSYETYRITAESQVIPYFEKLNLPVQKITATNVQEYFAYLAESGFKASTAPKHKSIIRASFEYAIDTLGIIDKNPADKIKTAKRTKRIPSFYTEEQLQALFAAMEGAPIEAVTHLAAVFGLRRCEALGLKWSAIDWKRKTITVKHTAVRVGSAVKLDDTVKEQASYRTLPLIKDMQIYLKKLYAHQRQMKALFGNCYNDNDYICKQDDGTLFDPNFVAKKFGSILKSKNLPKIRFHDLRHSSASLLINNGFSIKEVQEWLGHADIASTEIYAHLLYKSKENMAAKIGSLLFGSSEDASAEESA